MSTGAENIQMMMNLVFIWFAAHMVVAFVSDVAEWLIERRRR